MAVFRVTFGFAGANTGWTETHACNPPGSLLTAQAVLPFTKAVAQARVQMLGAPFVLNGTRISVYSDGALPAHRVTPRNVFLDKTIYSCSLNAPAAPPPSEPSPVQLQAQGFAALTGPAQYTGNENWTYLGGPFDACVTNAGQVLPAELQLNASFNTWKAAMLAGGFGWLAVYQIGTPLPITGVANSELGQLIFTVNDAGTPMVNGTVYNIRVSRINNGRSPANGPFVATYNATAHTLTTQEQVAFTNMQVGGQVQAYSRTLGFAPYGNLVLALQTIKHKRGKPFLSPPGRARRRVRA